MLTPQQVARGHLLVVALESMASTVALESMASATVLAA